MQKLKIGIIGCGSISSQRHIPSVCRNKKLKLVAICDIDNNKAMLTAKKFKIPSYYSDYKEMLEKEEIDIIDIATPIQFHKQQAIDAIKLGKHVIVEKPIAASSKDAEEMIEVAKKNKVLLSVYHTMRAYPVIQEIKRILEKKEIGNTLLLQFLTTYGELQPWLKKQKWGALWEIGIHRIYLALYLLGKVKKVNAESYEGQKNFKITLFSENGIGEIHILNSGFDFASDFLTIYGEKGKITAPSPEFNTFTKIDRKEENWLNIFKEEIFNNIKLSSAIAKRGFEYITSGSKILPHYLILDNFVNATLHHERLLIPPEEGLEALKILEKVESILDKSG